MAFWGRRRREVYAAAAAEAAASAAAQVSRAIEAEARRRRATDLGDALTAYLCDRTRATYWGSPEFAAWLLDKGHLDLAEAVLDMALANPRLPLRSDSSGVRGSLLSLQKRLRRMRAEPSANGSVRSELPA